MVGGEDNYEFRKVDENGQVALVVVDFLTHLR